MKQKRKQRLNVGSDKGLTMRKQTCKLLLKRGRWRVYIHENGSYTYQYGGQVLARRVPLSEIPYELQADCQ
jgi:hypothetical protein